MKITDDMVEQACLTYGRIMLASGKMWNPSEAGQDAMRAALEAVINPLPDRYYELTEADVGRAMIHAFGKTWAVRDFMGTITHGDVGKRMYRVLCHGGDVIVQVENNKQRDARLDAERLARFGELTGDRSLIEAAQQRIRKAEPAPAPEGVYARREREQQEWERELAEPARAPEGFLRGLVEGDLRRQAGIRD
jgi:hypothetical protein